MSTRRALLFVLAVLVATLAALPRPSNAHAQAPVLPALRTAHAAVSPLLGDGANPNSTDPERPAPDALGSDLRDGRITQGWMHHRVLHLTFDDGPRPRTTRRLLDTLDEYGVHATFFVVGRQLEGSRHADQRALVREMARRGHTIGTHTWDHADLTTLSDAEIARELTRSEAVLQRILGGRPFLIRPPYGARNRRVDTLLADRGYTEVLWNVTTADTSSRDPQEVLAEFRRQLDRQERHPRGPGGIVLLHDTHEWVVDAVPLLLDEVRSRNCAILAEGDASEELWDLADDIRLFYRPRAGSAPRFVAPVELDPDTLASRQARVRAAAAELCD